MTKERDVIGEVIEEDRARAVPPSVAQFVGEQSLKAGGVLPDGVTIDQVELARLVRELALRSGKAARPLMHAAAIALESQARELAALKARQAGGVVLPERRPEVSGTWGDMGDAYSAGINDTIDEVVRLNSPPVSAGGVDELAAFEAWYAKPEAFKAGDSNGWRGIAWASWQARAELSAAAPPPAQRKISPHYVTPPNGDSTWSGDPDRCVEDFLQQAAWISDVREMMNECTYTNTYGQFIKCGVSGGCLYVDGCNVGAGVFYIPPGAQFKAVRNSYGEGFSANFAVPRYTPSAQQKEVGV